MYKILKELNDTGKLQELVNAGIISTKVSNHFNMYETYLKQLSSIYIKNKPEAIEKTSICHGVCNCTVYKVVSKMNP